VGEIEINVERENMRKNLVVLNVKYYRHTLVKFIYSINMAIEAMTIRCSNIAQIYSKEADL
jgi:hypothetical protein